MHEVMFLLCDNEQYASGGKKAKVLSLQFRFFLNVKILYFEQARLLKVPAVFENTSI